MLTEAGATIADRCDTDVVVMVEPRVDVEAQQGGPAADAGGDPRVYATAADLSFVWLAASDCTSWRSRSRRLLLA
jgi:hypothetical protein